MAAQVRHANTSGRAETNTAQPGDDRIYYGRSVTSGDYPRLLAANGYTLSAVEEVVTGTKTSDEVYDEYLAETGKSEPPGGAGLRFCPTPLRQPRPKRKRLRRCSIVGRPRGAVGTR